MANEEQLTILRTGVKTWNRWRADHPTIDPDLSGAELGGATLSGADLSGARLDGADLAGADLSLHLEDVGYLFEAFGVPGAPKVLGLTSLKGAQLKDASLKGARLDAVDLRGANLRRADLSLAVISAHSMEPCEALSFSGMTIPANLTATQLDEALLYKTIFNDVLLHKTSFHKTKIAGTQFLHVGLSNISNLADALHIAPARIDIETLELTAAGLDGKPSVVLETFLRDAGLPVEYLDSFRQRLNGARFYSCFISHSSVDQAFCRKLCHRMRAEGLRVWFAPEDIQGGRRLHDQIKGAIQSHDKLLLVLSEDSIKSSWVELEIRETLKYENETGRRMLFPISVTDFEVIRRWSLVDADTGQDLAVKIREFFIPDFSRWKDDEAFEESFQRLAADLQGSEVGNVVTSEPESEASSPDGVFARVWR